MGEAHEEGADANWPLLQSGFLDMVPKSMTVIRFHEVNTPDRVRTQGVSLLGYYGFTKRNNEQLVDLAGAESFPASGRREDGLDETTTIREVL